MQTLGLEWIFGLLGVSRADKATDDEDLVLQPFDRDLALIADTREFAVDKVCGFGLGDVEAGAVEAIVRGHAVVFRSRGRCGLRRSGRGSGG